MQTREIETRHLGDPHMTLPALFLLCQVKALRILDGALSNKSTMLL